MTPKDFALIVDDLLHSVPKLDYEERRKIIIELVKQVYDE